MFLLALLSYALANKGYIKSACEMWKSPFLIIRYHKLTKKLIQFWLGVECKDKSGTCYS